MPARDIPRKAPPGWHCTAERLWKPAPTAQPAPAAATLAAHLRAVGLDPVLEIMVQPGTTSRFDLGLVALGLLIEVDGGIFKRAGAKPCPHCGATPQGSHTTGQGYLRNMRKRNEAAIRGWRVVAVTPKEVGSGAALRLIECAMGEGRA